MHYYQVPRLGSYMAIKLVYNSCLFEDAYDDAISNYEAVNQFKKDQAQEKVDWQNQQDEIARERAELGEEYEPEEKQWPEYKYAAFKTQPVEYVVCLNTMGQDRQFTQEEKDFALNCVKNYRNTWETLEVKNIEHDVQVQISHQAYDKLYKEHYAGRDEAEMEKVINEAIAAAENVQNQEGDDPLTDLEKEIISRKARFT